jgi:hypothetical protein
MTARGSRIEEGGWPARSVLECGSPLVLCRFWSAGFTLQEQNGLDTTNWTATSEPGSASVSTDSSA